MARFERGRVRIEYEERGEGFPVLLVAPGGMRSAMDLWSRSPFDPRETLADGFRVIAMDQRNAGASVGPVSASDGWHTFAADQLALLDHLGVDRFHVLGMCIGGSYGLRLMQAAPERVASGVLLQPIGHDDNREAFREMFDGWARELAAQREDVEPDVLEALRSNLFDGDFVFSVDRDFVRGCPTPMLVLRGNDTYHPARTSEELAELAPHAELVREWKEGPAVDAALARVRDFLAAHA
jgi:pimeloyl-ACP methyl ester carboxylesterase